MVHLKMRGDTEGIKSPQTELYALYLAKDVWSYNRATASVCWDQQSKRLCLFVRDSVDSF